MNFTKYFLIISTLCLNLALQKTLHAAANSGTGIGVVEDGVAEYKPAEAAPHNPFLGYGVAVSAPATIADHSALAVSAAGGETAAEEPLAHQAIGGLPTGNLANIASFLSERDLTSLAASHRKGRSIRDNQAQRISNNLIFPGGAEIVNPKLKLFFAKAIMQLNHQPNNKNKYNVTPEIANHALENARLAGFGEENISAIMDILVASVDEYQKPFREAFNQAALLLQPYPGIPATIAEARAVLARANKPLMQMAIRMLWHKNHPMVENLDEIDIKQIITITPTGHHPILTLNFGMLTAPTKQDVQNIIDLISVLHKNILALSIKPFHCAHEIHITGNFPNLTNLNAPNTNQLTSIDARLSAPNLQALSLNESGIKTISGSFPKLTEISANNASQLISIDEKLIVPNLKRLFLDESGIKAISGYFPTLPEINATNTSQLVSIDEKLIAPNLQKLWLTQSGIKTISGDFNELTEINANDTNQLSSINEKLIAPSLQKLFLNESGINAISGYFPNLTNIQADNTSQLSSIDESLIAPNLNILFLEGSSIKTISGYFENLTEIWAGNTAQLISINERLIAPNLTYLRLCGSSIKTISGDFKNLTYIDVRQTWKLIKIDESLIAPKLQELNVTGSSIKIISGDFSKLTNIQADNTSRLTLVNLPLWTRLKGDTIIRLKNIIEKNTKRK